MRRMFNYMLSLFAIVLLATTATAQNGQFDVRFSVKNYDCANNKVTIQVQVKAHDASHTFLMGDANYRFDYDPRIIKNPAIVSQENFSNVAPSSNTNYVPQNLNGSSAGPSLGTVSLNTIYGGGGLGATTVGTNWMTVSCIRFDVQDPTQCMWLRWHDDQTFPVTGMNEVEILPSADGNYNLYVVAAGGVFDNLSVCTRDVCSSVLALDDINSTLVNTAVSGSVATNDVSNGGAMTFNTTLLAGATRGTLTLSANGSYTYTPATGYVGADSARYIVCNAAGLCDTAWLRINIIDAPQAGVNSPPVASNDNGVTNMNTPLNSSVLGNDIDPDGNTLTVSTTPITSPSNGTLVLNANGTYTYTPNPNFFGQDTFRYQVCDNGVPSKCDTAMVTLNVLIDNNGAGNDRPNAGDDAFSTAINTPITGATVAGNDTDPNGNALTYTTTPIANVAHGTLTLNANGTFTYTPTTGYVGADAFTYKVCDNGSPSLCDTATVYLMVTPSPNLPPVINEVPVTNPEDSVLTVCLPITDPNATDTHTVTPCAAPQHGTATATVNNTTHQVCITYTPTPNYNGVDTACFIVCDNGIPSKCDTIKLPITVTPVNDTPVVTETPQTGVEDMPISACFPIADPDAADTHTVTPCAAPQHGTATATVNNTTHEICFTYTPTLNYNGVDTACFIVCDNGTPSKCDTIKIPLVITPSNDPPVITVVPVVNPEDSILTVCLPIVDPDATDTHTVTPCAAPQHGTATATVNNTTHQVCITYTPTPNYVGVDTACFIVCDNGSPSKCDTIKLPITVTPVNDAPVVTETPQTGGEDTPISACFPIADPDAADTHTVTPCAAPQHGTATATVNNTTHEVCFTYTPTLNYNGVDTACFIVCDNGSPSKCDTIKIPLVITPSNDPPVVPDVTSTIPNNTPTTVCQTISDPEAGDTHTYSSCGAPTHGTLTTTINNATHQICLTYTPTTGFVGQDSVCVIVCDNGSPSKCDTLKWKMTVTPTNNAPIAINDINVTLQGVLATGSLTGNDSDPDGNTITINTTPVQNSSHGSIVILPNGTYTYTPTASYVGMDTVLYKICDNGVPSLCDTAKLIIEIRPTSGNGVNQQPIALDDNTSTPSDTPIRIAVKSNDTDPDGNTLGNPTLIGTPIGGTPVVNPDGTVTFTPAPGFSGSAVFQYSVCDNGSPVKCDTASVNINVYPDPNQANVVPNAIDDAAITSVNTPVSGNAATNDSDPNAGQILTYTQLTAATNGTLTLSATGLYTYTPNTGFVGTDSVQYRACDNGSPILCDVAWIRITVQPATPPATNVKPVANDDAPTTTVNTPIVIPVKANDFDPNGDPLNNPTIIGTPTGGTPVVNPDGTVTFTPTPGFVGTAVFEYQVCDTGTPSLCDTAKVTITVTPPIAAQNSAPNAIDDAYTTLPNTPVAGNIATNDSDPDGNTLTFTRLTPPTSGLVTSFNPLTGAFSYTPIGSFVGVDSFQYKVCDNGVPSLCDTAWVRITIAAAPLVNVPPVANDDVLATNANTPTTINVKANDFDPNGNPLTNPAIVGTPVGGTVVVNPDGTVTFTPTPGFVGTAVFEYQVCDNGNPALCDTAKVTITVNPTPPPVNVAPIAQNDATTTPINTPVFGNASLNDSDPNTGQTLTYSVVTNTPNGNLTINPTTGVYTYTPNTGFTGRDSAVYRVCDNGAPVLCTTAKIFIDVTPAGVNQNDKPIANDDAVTTTTAMPVIIPVKGNDLDPDPNQTLSNPMIIGTPVGGTPVVNPDGTVTFTPTPGFTGTATFQYAICDNGAPILCDTATVTVTVNPNSPPGNINLQPVAIDDANSTVKNTPVSGNVGTNDTDPNVGQTLTFSLITAPTHGLLTLNANGTYIYTPLANYIGPDVFTYQVCDNGAPVKCDTAQAFITVFDNPCITLTLKVLLEGPFQTATNRMTTILNQRGLLPGQTVQTGQFAVPTIAGQPYKGAPWNYAGTEGDAITTYPATVTDWVLVSLRTSTATASTVFRAAAWLHNDGTVEFLTPCINVPSGNYYVVIEHRNHMGAMSPTAVPLANGVLNFDFTAANGFELTNPPSFGQKLKGSKWTMYAGDGFKTTQVTNFDINFNDSQLWKGQSGIFDQYKLGDFNLDADVNFNDQVLWKLNNGRYSGVPH